MLYKYRSLRTATDVEYVCDTIMEGRLYWSSPLSFNDPFDCVPVHIYKGSKAEHRQNAWVSTQAFGADKSRAERRQMRAKALRRKGTEIVDLMSQANINLLKIEGVCSLAEERDNILMWAHYADSHAGLCLGFEPSLEAIDFVCAYQVLYSEERPVLNLIRRAEGHELMDKVLLTKSAMWSYEREWRMIAHDIQNRLRRFPPRALQEVVFGSRITSEAKAIVLEAISRSRSNPKIFQASANREKFALDINEEPPS
ncbi:MAG: hypothetical protein QOG13_2323 [Sphingomonadales bacterium]|jgi:hypothetical protein|nr:hypothetical protein [Sphingomonadales bacterium]MEA3043122.1 hypothetical protein [Sphingomonadales bacterium]